MYDFPDNKGLQWFTRETFKRGGVLSSVCHGYCGLLNTRLSDGSYLVARRNMIGFTWREEVLARVNKLVPYNAEEKLKKRGASYKKAKLPFVSYTVVDGNLVTGQNPGSAKETARKIVAVLGQS
jgi:putative intracellular protease/amidase